MAIPYHTHRFTIPQASKADVKDGTRTDVALVPASVGSAAASQVTDFATAAQGAKADTALQPGDIGSDITGPISQFVDNGFPSHQSGKSYGQGAYVRYVTGGGSRVYRSKVSNNTALPTDAGSWEQIGDLAFRNTLNVTDITASGTPDNTTFLRGDGSWTASTALVYGRDNFVTNSTIGPFPDNGEWVVYAMNGPNAPANPDATYFFQLGYICEYNGIVDGWGTKALIEGKNLKVDLNDNSKASLSRADNALPRSEAGALAYRSNVGRAEMATTNDPTTPGYLYNNGGDISWQPIQNTGGRWVDNPSGNIYEDENILINNRGTERGCNFYRDGSGINITSGENIVVLSSVRDRRIPGCFCIHFFDINRHYTVMGTGIFIQ